MPYTEGLYYWYQELLTGKSQTKPILTPSSILEVNFDMEQRSLVADGADWVFVYVKGGTDEVTLSLSGPGTIIGDGEDIEANPVKVDERTKIATFLVQTTTTPGKIVATAKSGEGTASASVTSVASQQILFDADKVAIPAKSEKAPAAPTKDLGYRKVKDWIKFPVPTKNSSLLAGTDLLIVLSEQHLKRIVQNYLDYYHDCRTHLSLDRNSPNPRPVAPRDAGEVFAIPRVGGLHHEYRRAA